MAHSIVKTNGARTEIDVMSYAGNLTEPQVELIKRTVITGGTRPVTNDELALFLTICSRRGLDPFSSHVYGIMRKTKQKDGSWAEQLVIQVGIDGYRLLAEKTGKYEGMVGPFWCGPDGQWTDVWLSNEPPSAAKVGVYRTGCRDPFWGVVTYREFAQTYDGKPMGKWKEMPATMLAKCAESAAIRKAFPQAVGGVTTPEMAGADTESYEVTEGDRAQAHILEDRKAEQNARGRQPWVEEIDAPIEGVVRTVQAPAPAAANAPDVVLEAIAAATTVAAVEAVMRRDDWREDIHKAATDQRLVGIVSAALDGLDWSQPAAVERRLKVAAIKLDRMDGSVPGWNIAIDKLEAARQQLADLDRVAAA